jgi:hypothetical protein
MIVLQGVQQHLKGLRVPAWGLFPHEQAGAAVCWCCSTSLTALVTQQLCKRSFKISTTLTVR